MKTYFSIFCFLGTMWWLNFTSNFSTNEKKIDYSYYHLLINKAEYKFYINKDVDSCLILYNKAFSEFDYVFLKDLVNAAQISVFCDKPYEPYILKGFENGLKIEHLKNIPLLKFISDGLCFNDLSLKYQKLRKKYLSKINFSLLLSLYDLGIKDQIDKNLSKTRYKYSKMENFHKIMDWISKYGFPAEKLVGVDDRSIFSEIGSPQLDRGVRKLKFSANLGYYNLDDNSLSSSTVFNILVHSQCCYSYFKDYFDVAIKKGEIHPREVGLLYDNYYRNIGENCGLKSHFKGVFLLNSFCNYKKLDIDTIQVDSLRKCWNIVPLQVDQVKKYYEEKYNFKIFWGYWNVL